MTTGEYLVAHSSLSSGTALAHLLALQVGAGTGQTILCSQISTVVERDELVVTRKAKLGAIQAQPIAPPKIADKPRNAVSVFHATPSIHTIFQADELTVTRRTVSVTTQRRLSQQTITGRGH